MTQINLLRQVKNLNFPEGFLINWQIVTSVKNLVSNNSFETDVIIWNKIYSQTKPIYQWKVRTIIWDDDNLYLSDENRNSGCPWEGVWSLLWISSGG